MRLLLCGSVADDERMSQPTPAHWYSHPAARGWRTSPPASAREFHRSLEGYAPTPLVDLPTLAAELGVGRVLLKDESDRLGLPAFKILGASWAVCRALRRRYDLHADSVPALKEALHSRLSAAELPVLVTATDGNHGRAVARMAALLKIPARIYVPAGLSAEAVDGITGEGAALHEADASYDDVVTIAATATAGSPRDVLVQDTAWPGYTEVPQWIADGYGTLFAEVDDALAVLGISGPDLVACPVGVGSLAQALVEHYRCDGVRSPVLLTTEPETAACITRSLTAGEPLTVDTSRPTMMAGLNCGTPSTLGWPSLRAGIDASISISEDACRRAVLDLADLGLDVGPCGAASLAGARAALGSDERRAEMGLDGTSTLVLVSTEGLAANPLR